jgi:transcriptional regulator with XRE-family HTH domain
MANNEKYMDFLHMRQEGCTLQQIANKYGCTRQYVSMTLRKINQTPSRTRARRKCVYSGLDRWLHENSCSITRLGKSIGVYNVTIAKYMNGEREIKIGAIRDILRLTGMTFEEAFGGVRDGKA